MSVIKNRLKNKFSQIPNEVVTDTRISNGAFRVIIYLFTKPDNWEVNNEDVMKSLKISKDHTISKYWKELLKSGWITRERTETGHFDYNLNEHPILPIIGSTHIAHNGQLPKKGGYNNKDPYSYNNNTNGGSNFENQEPHEPHVNGTTDNQLEPKPIVNQIQTSTAPIDPGGDEWGAKTEKHSPGRSNEAEEAFSEYELEFETFRKIFPGTKRGLSTEFQNFKKKHKDWKEILPKLHGIIQKQIEYKKSKKLSGGFVPEWKHMQTWINQRCWEEETPIATATEIDNQLDNYDLPPNLLIKYNSYLESVQQNFPALLKSSCRIYSKDDFFDLSTDRTVTARRNRITDRKYQELWIQAHRDLTEKPYLRTQHETVYDYTRKLMRQELEHA